MTSARMPSVLMGNWKLAFSTSPPRVELEADRRLDDVVIDAVALVVVVAESRRPASASGSSARRR
jgi:hypothetical protein